GATATRGDRRPGTLARDLRGARSGAGEDHRDVVTAEAEGVVERRYVAGRQIDRGVLCDLHRGLGVERLDVDRGWGHAVVDSERREQGLQRTGATHQVTGHRLGRGDHDLVGGVVQGRADGFELPDVAQRGRRAVGVEVDDVLR